MNDKGWPECNVIMEEGSYDELDDKVYKRRCQALVAFLGFVVLFTVFCLIIWGAGRSYKAEVAVRVNAICFDRIVFCCLLSIFIIVIKIPQVCILA